MSDINSWNWEIGERRIDLTRWHHQFEWVEEFCVSPDGEKIAAIVKLGEQGFGVCRNGDLWEKDFSRVWHLRFSPDGRLTALVSEEDEWAIAVDGRPWENKFDYVWNTLFSPDGRDITVACQKDMAYFMTTNDVPWENEYANMTDMTLGPDGQSTAATVQVAEVNEGDIFAFQEGAYTIAANGRAWGNSFVNAWKACFSADCEKIAAQVRLNLYDYTIAVNGEAWEQIFECVWEPVFNPRTGRVAAPVQQRQKWTVAENGRIIWDRRFVQVWRLLHSPDSSRLAAVVSPSFGKWTIAIDGRPWRKTFGDLVTDTVFSPIKKNGKYSMAVNDALWDGSCEALWPPVFSHCSKKMLVRTIEKGIYSRRVIPVNEIIQA